MTDSGANRPFPIRPVVVTLAAGLAIGLPLALWLLRPASERPATPGELLRAIAGFPEDPDAVPPFRAAAELEPTSFLQLAQDPEQTEILRRLFVEPRDVLQPEAEQLLLLSPRGRTRATRPPFEVELQGAPPDVRLRIHLLDLDRDGVTSRIPLATTGTDPQRPAIRAAHPTTHGLMPGRYAWWVEPVDPLETPLVGAGGTATFTVLDHETTRTIESYLPGADGRPLTRLRRAAVLLAAGLAQEALGELEAGGFPTDRAVSDATHGDPLQETATLLAAAAWRRLGDLEAVARQISALIQPR